MENMEGLVTLVFFKIESTNLANRGIVMQIFPKVIYFQIQSFCDVSLAFLKVEAQNLVSWGILTCSLKFQYFISIILFADTLQLKLYLTLMTSL